MGVRAVRCVLFGEGACALCVNAYFHIVFIVSNIRCLSMCKTFSSKKRTKGKMVVVMNTEPKLSAGLTKYAFGEFFI